MAAPGRPAASERRLPPDIEAAELPADAIEVGRILDAWGIKGWFKVLPHSADPQALFSSTRWYLQPAEQGPRAFSGTVLLRVRETKDHADTVVARADGVDDRSAAEALNGVELVVDVAGASNPDDDEDAWYPHELVGLRVEGTDGRPLGEVVGLDPGPAHDVLVVREVGGQRTLVPFVRAIVPVVDVRAGRVVLDPPGGLLAADTANLVVADDRDDDGTDERER